MQTLITFIQSWWKELLDIGLVLLICYALLLLIEEQRTYWVVRGLLYLLIALAFSNQFGFNILGVLLTHLIIGSTVALGLLYQSQLRRFLELLGKGNLRELFDRPRKETNDGDSVIDEIVSAVKDLSQNRTGALMILETDRRVDEEDFQVQGVILNAQVSRELLQTIFQTSTLLHDGAVFIRGSRLVSAGVILPLSDRTASRQLGTRHRAAMGITERMENCLCIVVSEETGSISLAEKGFLNRPLTSSKLKELLETKFSPAIDREAVAPTITRIGRNLGFTGRVVLERILRFPSRKDQ